MSSQVTEDQPIPGVAFRPGGIGVLLLKRLLGCLHCGALAVTLPDGRRVVHRTGRPGPDAVLVLHRWRTLRRALLGGDIGFGEAYIGGDWSSPDVTKLIELAARNRVGLPGADGGPLLHGLAQRLRHLGRANTLPGSRRNIKQHYDLGNDFYASWLDRGMTYSSGLFVDGGADLEAAQLAKQDRVMALLDLRPGQRVLEIGFGWGGLVERLAAAGYPVTGLTLSPAQHAYAQARLQEGGLAPLADLRVEDYRDSERKLRIGG
jgi:cyclopropane-fatty-acyl-phospholipid synthase